MNNRLSLTLLFFFLLSPLWSQAIDLRVVFVDLDRVFSEFYKTKLADAQLKEQIEDLREERQEVYDEFVQLQKDFNRLRDESTKSALSEEERQKLTRDASDKLQSIREYENKLRRMDESRRKQVEEQGRRMRKRIVDDIRETVSSYADAQGFDAVLDTSGQSLNGVDIVLYSNARVDVTDTIIELLNKSQIR